MPAPEPELRAHLDWLGFAQPVGLVVSAPALVAQQAFVNRDVSREQEKLRALLALYGYRTRNDPCCRVAPCRSRALAPISA